MGRPLAQLTWLWKFIDWVGDKTTIPESWIKPVLSIALFHANITPDNPRPRLRNIHVVLFGRGNKPLDKAEQGGVGYIVSPRLKEYVTRVRDAMPKFNTHGDSLYYNCPIFIRIALPFFFGIQFRWSGATDSRAFMQVHVGWKLNGRLAFAARIQSDKTAEHGMDFPNPGQAKGWEYTGK